MTDIQKTIQTLRQFNLWRKGDDAMEQPDPWGIGEAIDEAIEAMEELNEWRTLNGWGGTPEIINDFIKGQQSRIYAAQEAEEQRDKLAEALDMLDEVIKKMRPRYMGHPTMDGRFPCWNVWMPHTGTTERKSLKEAVLEYIAAAKGGKP
jgi:hypothetical protein